MAVVSVVAVLAVVAVVSVVGVVGVVGVVAVVGVQPRPQGFSLKKWVGREKALASAGHVHSLNIPEKLIYILPASFALTEVERTNNGKY